MINSISPQHIYFVFVYNFIYLMYEIQIVTKLLWRGLIQATCSLL